jgi:hypothetical protein
MRGTKLNAYWVFVSLGVIPMWVSFGPLVSVTLAGLHICNIQTTAMANISLHVCNWYVHVIFDKCAPSVVVQYFGPVYV